MSDEAKLLGVRRKEIADLVERHGSLAVRDLCKEFGMSEATIRRDLRDLDERGVVTRTRGGAMINARVMSDLPNEERKLVRVAEKIRIGKAAIEMLAGDEVVFLDAGTTALAVAENANRRPDCRYVTTCLGVARRLRDQDIRNFYLVGGAYQRVNDSFAGALAISALRTLTFDIAFLCCSGIDIARRSISIADEAYSQVQREAVKASRKNIVIAHSEKFDTSAFIRTAGFEDLNGIITDDGLDADMESRIRGLGLEVTAV